jgi:hypothetical protein
VSIAVSYPGVYVRELSSTKREPDAVFQFGEASEQLKPAGVGTDFVWV